MDADDLQRTRHNATKLTENVMVMYDALKVAGIDRDLRDQLILVYWKLILETVVQQEANKTLATLLEGLKPDDE